MDTPRLITFTGRTPPPGVVSGMFQDTRFTFTLKAGCRLQLAKYKFDRDGQRYIANITTLRDCADGTQTVEGSIFLDPYGHTDYLPDWPEFLQP